MSAFRKCVIYILMLGVIGLSGCAPIVRPLQITSSAKPEIIIYHRIPTRTLGVVYVITVEDNALSAWKKLEDNQITLKAGIDFQVFRGRQVHDVIKVYRNLKLEVSGKIEIEKNRVIVDLDIIPGNHPIDGIYPLTNNKPLQVIFTDAP